MIARAGETGQFERVTTQRSSIGAVTPSTWSALGASFPCWVQSADAELVEHYSARTMMVTHKMYAQVDRGAREGDRFRLIAMDGGPDKVFLVHGIADQAGLRRLWRYALEERRPP